MFNAYFTVLSGLLVFMFFFSINIWLAMLVTTAWWAGIGFYDWLFPK